MESGKFQEYFPPRIIGEGNQGLVYRISEDYVAKIPRPNLLHYTIESEIEIAQSLFLKGISVPKPEGIFPIQLPFCKRDGFVMQFIDGKMGYQVRNKKVPHVKKLLNKELEKAKDIGFLSGDAFAKGNYIWKPEEDRIYLIDFALWSEIIN